MMPFGELPASPSYSVKVPDKQYVDKSKAVDAVTVGFVYVSYLIWHQEGDCRWPGLLGEILSTLHWLASTHLRSTAAA